MLGFKNLDLICFCEMRVHTFGIKVLANRTPSVCPIVDKDINKKLLIHLLFQSLASFQLQLDGRFECKKFSDDLHEVICVSNQHEHVCDLLETCQLT